jgi:hypothetical protein
MRKLLLLIGLLVIAKGALAQQPQTPRERWIAYCISEMQTPEHQRQDDMLRLTHITPPTFEQS